MRSILDDVLLHGQNSAPLEAAHTLLRTLTSDRKYARAMNSGSSTVEILEEKGFGGLWRSCSMGSMEDVHRDCFDLTEKLIEVSHASDQTYRSLSRLTFAAHHHLATAIVDEEI